MAYTQLIGRTTLQMVVVWCLFFLIEIIPVDSQIGHYAKVDPYSSSSTSSKRPDWDYSKKGPKGPDNWHKKHPDCKGVMQSPINIESKQAIYTNQLPYFNLADYYKTDGVTMKIVKYEGHTAEVKFYGSEILLQGGGLPAHYKLAQCHFHWGKESNRGSEHSIDNQFYPLEMHIVHHIETMDSVKTAKKQPWGLAVLSYMFKIDNQKNEKFDQVLDHFHKIQDVADTEFVIPTFPLADLLPKTRRVDFYRYHGSLTTPGCWETVTWSIAIDPISIAEEQMDKFRMLTVNGSHGRLFDDYRPIQELNSRVVQTTFRPKTNSNQRQMGSSLLPLLGLLLMIDLF